MAASADTRQLQLQISASAELLIRNLKQADNAIADFQQDVDRRLDAVDRRFDALGKLKGKLKGKLGNLDTSIGIGDVVGAATGVTLVSLAARGLEYASSLGEVAQQLGVTTRDLQVYRYEASQAGIDQEVMDKSLAKLTVTLGKAALGAKEPKKAFEAIGLSLDDLKGKTAGEVIPLIADGLSKIPDPAKRAAIEVALFGKAGQQLDTLLAGGSGQINELAKAAQELGLVLSDEQIQSADATADKLSEVKQVLEAEIAGVVADNAGSITALATSLGQLTSAVLAFLNANPQAAIGILGALAGGRVAGAYGALAGGIIGIGAGEVVSRNRDDQNGDVANREKQLAASRRELAIREGKVQPTGVRLPFGFVLRFTESKRSGATIDDARAEVRRQEGLLAAARAAAVKPKTPSVPTINLPEIFGSGGGGKPKGKSAEQLQREADQKAKRERQQERTANGLLQRAELEALDRRAALADDPAERLRIEEQRIDLARKGRDADLDEQAIDNKFIAANLARLKTANAEAAEGEKRLRAARLAQEQARDTEEARRARADDQVALLQIEAGLVDIARDRRVIERRILALKQDEERRALQAVVDDKTGRFSPGDQQVARESLARLPRRQAAERASLDRAQARPLERYRQELLQSVGDMNEALEGVEARGLATLEDGLVGLVTGTQSVKDAFKSMAASIIADLARIAIRKAILAAIGGGSPGFADGGEIPGFANGGSPGGLIRGPGTGRSDSILALLAGPGGGAIRVSAGETIMNERASRAWGPTLEAMNRGRLPRFADGGPIGGRYTLPPLRAARLPDLRGAGTGRQRIEVGGAIRIEPTKDFRGEMVDLSVRTVGAAAEPIMAGAEDRTMRRLSRPALPGAPG